METSAMESTAAEMPPTTVEMPPVTEEIPRLSGSQRAYLFRREAFLGGIAQRAQSLFADGYDVEPACQLRVFRIICPQNRKGERACYRVDVLGTCTCPFFTRQGTEPLTHNGTRIPCKHLVGLPGFLHAACRDSIRHKRLGRFYRLWHHWQGALKAEPSLADAWKACGPLFPRSLAPPQIAPNQGAVAATDTKGTCP